MRVLYPYSKIQIYIEFVTQRRHLTLEGWKDGCTDLRTWGRTDGKNEANSRFRICCAVPKKCQISYEI